MLNELLVMMKLLFFHISFFRYLTSVSQIHSSLIISWELEICLFQALCKKKVCSDVLIAEGGCDQRQNRLFTDSTFLVLLNSTF